jgi:hypothetical protein
MLLSIAVHLVHSSNEVAWVINNTVHTQIDYSFSTCQDDRSVLHLDSTLAKSHQVSTNTNTADWCVKQEEQQQFQCKQSNRTHRVSE